ncbi:MAG TPA: hypothetical protein VFZ25_21575 [Chloroflexota bacterium]|nr:hypothetical protein [Chloroflexota bacterium]
MGLLRLASRTVMGDTERASDLARVIPELSKLHVQPADVSLLCRSDTLETSPAQPRGKGSLAALGKGGSWLVEVQSVERPGLPPLIGAGPLASVLASSPNTSLVGAMVMQGIPQSDATTYANQVGAGRILLMIGVADRTLGERVRGLLERSGVQAVSYYAGRPYGTAYHGTGPGLR